MSSFREAARRGLAAVLRRLPDVVAEGLRKYAPVPVLAVVRHRGVPEGAVFGLPDNPAIRFAGTDSVVLQRVYWMGEAGYEPHVMPWWRECCSRAESVLEIGANVGYYTVQGARTNPRLRYLAIEPHPKNAEALRRNIELNGLGNVDVLQAAVVGDADGRQVELVVPEADHFSHPAGAFLADGELTLPIRDAVTVNTASAAELFADRNLIKIDTEGYEYTILNSVVDMLAQAKPTVFLELLDNTPRLHGLVAELGRGPYKILVPGRKVLYEADVGRVAETSFERSFRTRDVILTADERLMALSRPT